MSRENEEREKIEQKEWSEDAVEMCQSCPANLFYGVNVRERLEE